MKTTPNHKFTRRWTSLRDHCEQLRLWNDPSRFKIVPAGRRSGKTELAKRRLVESLFRKTWHGSPGRFFAAAPTRDQADAFLVEQMTRRAVGLDANDALYAFDASREYDPSKELEKITAPLLAINSADDQVNPPELGLVEKLMPRVKHGKFVLIPISDETRGHGTHSLPAVWGRYLETFLKEIQR